MNIRNCKCNQEATHACLKHHVYFCSADAEDHPCKTIELEPLINNLETKKTDVLNSFKVLSFENKKNKEELLRANKTMVQTLQKVKEEINTGIDRLLCTYDGKIKELVESMILDKTIGIEKEINRLSNDGDVISLNSFLNTVVYSKIRQEDNQTNKELKRFLDKDSLYNDLETYLNSLRNQVEGIQSVIKEFHIDNLENASKARENCYSEMSLIIHREISFFKRHTKTEDKIECDKDVIKTTVLKKIPEESPRPKSKSFTRFSFHRLGTKIVENSLDERLKNMEKKLNDKDAFSDSGLGSDDEMSINSSSFEDSDKESFDSLSDEEDKGFKKDFENSKGSFKNLLSKTIINIDQKDFFSVDGKKKVTDFLERFNKDCEDVTTELLLNFNKL